MTWLRIEDGTAEHPKIVGLSDAAFRLWLNGLCYASRYSTDGFLPDSAVAQWGRVKARSQLLELGLWTRNGAGYAIHDFLDYNPTKAALVAQRAGAAERKRRSRSGADASLLTPWRDE